MPVAEGSLQDALDANGPMSEGAAADVLSQVARGLVEASDFVHRDLKPANILRFDGNWRIADFGIARFVEDSTSTETLKDCLSPHFAAPEQWRYEHATAATDIYALGCIAHALLTGAPPFVGSPEQLRDQHLHATPAAPQGCSAQMGTLLSMMLRKVPTARPSIGRVVRILERLQELPSTSAGGGGLDRLAAAAAAHERAQAEADAERQRETSARADRNALAAEARRILEGIFQVLADRIAAAVPNATVRSSGSSHVIAVGSATLELDLSLSGTALSRDAFPRSEWDVVCGAAVEVVQASPVHKRAASLWYTRRDNPQGDFRWYEVGYEGNPLTRKGFEFEPAAVTPELADRAHWAAMDVIQTSYPAVPIDDEDVDAFCARWEHILAEACSNRLHNMPRGLARPT